MTILPFALVRVGAAGLLFLAAFFLGLRLTKALPLPGTAERLFVSSGLGLGVVGTLVYLLGLLHVLHGSVLAAVLLSIIAVSCRGVVAEEARRLRDLWRGRRASGSALVLCALAAGLLGPVLLLALYPPMEWDATMYHLTAARIYAESHAVVFVPHLRQNWFPQLAEMLFTACLLWFDDVTAQVLQVGVFALSALGLYAWGARLGGRGAGAVAAALWLASPAPAWDAATAYIDTGVALFALLGAYSLHAWLEGRGQTWAALSGAFFGFAAGTKYGGLVIAAVSFVTFGCVAGYRRRVRDAVLFVGLFVASAGPWYVRTWATTGDPVYPVASLLTGGSRGPLTAEESADLVAEMRRRYGVSRTPANLVRLPWLVASSPLTFGEYDRGLGTLFLPFTCLAAAAWLFDRRLLAPLAILLGFAVHFFAGLQILRFLIDVLPLVFLLGVATLAAALRRFLPPRASGPVLLAAAVAAAAAPPTAQTQALKTLRERGPLPTTESARTAYLGRWLSLYPAVEAMNRRRPAPWIAYGLRSEEMPYFATGTLIGDHFGPGRYSALRASLGSGRQLYDFLRRFPADYLLVATEREKPTLPSDEFFRSHFRLIFKSPAAEVYEIVPGGAVP